MSIRESAAGVKLSETWYNNVFDFHVRKHGTIHKTNVRRAVTRRAYRVLGQGRATIGRYACETRLWELEQQFEVKAAKVREEYLAAVLEIHASEANGKQHAHHSCLIRIRYTIWKVRARFWLVERLRARAGRLARPE